MNATQETLKAQLEFHFGDRLAKSLAVANVSNNDMATYLGKSRTTISNWIHGRAPISRGDLVAWALKTGVPLEWLETGNFPETPETEKAPTPKGEGNGAAYRTRTDPYALQGDRTAEIIPLFQAA